MDEALPKKLIDAGRTGRGSGAELLIVEGNSAASSVARARHRAWQAVVPVQGKPLNAAHAQRATVADDPQVEVLLRVLGTGWAESCDPQRCRYDRIVLLCDADADGIHSRALLLLFFHRWLRPLLDSAMVFAARPPLFAVLAPGTDDDAGNETKRFVYTEAQRDRVVAELRGEGHREIEIRRFKSIAMMSGDDLFSTCLDPATRTLTKLRAEHAESAMASFRELRRSGLSMRRDGR